MDNGAEWLRFDCSADQSSSEKMMTVFLGVKGIALIDISPEKAKLSSEYFRENSNKELDLIVYPIV
jgi:hypothetical protein